MTRLIVALTLLFGHASASLAQTPPMRAPGTTGDGGAPAPPIDVERALVDGPKGTLTIRAIQGTRGAPDVGVSDVEIELYHRSRPIQKLRAKLDEHGMVMIRDVPVAMAIRPLVRMKHADVTYQDAGPTMDAQSPDAAMDLTVYETTDTPPAWRIVSRHVMIAPQPGYLDIGETTTIENPGDRTWVGAPADAQGRRAATVLVLPEGTMDLQLESGFHGWCCTSFAGRTLSVQMPMMPGRTTFRYAYKVPAESGHAVAQVGAPAPCDSAVFYVPAETSAIETIDTTPGSTQTIEGTLVRTFERYSLGANALAGLKLVRLDAQPTPASSTGPRAAGWWERFGPTAMGVAIGAGILVGAAILLFRAPRDKSKVHIYRKEQGR